MEKYRPQHLDDLISHKEIVGTSECNTIRQTWLYSFPYFQVFIIILCAVQRFMKEDRLPHLLFYGPPGTGKTSTILACAKMLYSAKEFNSMVLEVCMFVYWMWPLTPSVFQQCLVPEAKRGWPDLKSEICITVQIFERDVCKVHRYSDSLHYPPPLPSPQLNASDDRGIGIVRGQILSFASTRTIFRSGFKLVILDEADAMTNDAQNALRRGALPSSKRNATN